MRSRVAPHPGAHTLASGTLGPEPSPDCEFDDPPLEAQVKEATALPDGSIIGVVAAEVEVASMRGEAVASLAGIERLTGLGTLRVWDALTDLSPLVGLAQLRQTTEGHGGQVRHDCPQ